MARTGLAWPSGSFSEIGKEHGFEVVVSKDGRLFEPDQIGQWDAFVFYTTGNLTVPGGDKNPPDLGRRREGVLRRDQRGQGLHRHAQCHRHVRPPRPRNKGAEDPFIKLIGGEFSSHGPQQEVTIEVTDPHFPGMDKGFGESKEFKIKDEWYALKNLARRPARDHGAGDQGNDRVACITVPTTP